MRTVEASRFVRAQPAMVSRYLTPAAIVEAEGTFTVRSVDERDGTWLVDATARGLETRLRFERLDDGFYYEQAGGDGPLETMETALTYARENEGLRLEARSVVSLGVPPAALTDRVAAWKRRGELERALERLAADLE